jgi:hypothetical protein
MRDRAGRENKPLNPGKLDITGKNKGPKQAANPFISAARFQQK